MFFLFYCKLSAIIVISSLLCLMWKWNKTLKLDSIMCLCEWQAGTLLVATSFMWLGSDSHFEFGSQFPQYLDSLGSSTNLLSNPHCFSLANSNVQYSNTANNIFARYHHSSTAVSNFFFIPITWNSISPYFYCIKYFCCDHLFHERVI